ncbi:TerB family tellurite resistance protein [Fulvivirga sedimenti]|uniref:TerB family tellurite resistance protein n=1 Tax=Fulvivirga sedimenti TaxID=2879465 RepID=A0A9X1HJW7_9BACT|nr:TerB family tellurite resistance protein [Fulvivirga sedimenti]MCA6073524.1 TerB family tellurite resistance protein [Fulvivirga sedimenti]
MIGFFEFQYLSFKKKSLGNLIALAKSDGYMDPAEEQLLYKLGSRYGLKDRQITVMINNDRAYELFVPETHEQKMNMFFDLMQLVYADGIIATEEVDFCHNVAERFGYSPEIVPWLIGSFHKGQTPSTEKWKQLVEKARQEFISEN